MSISTFDGDYAWLSNFYSVSVVLDGVNYPSVENAYQAAKTTVRSKRKPFEYCTAGQAKRNGRTLTVRPDWEAVKLTIMRDLLEQKFRRHTALADMLLATGDTQLVEGNTWGDTFWGMCQGAGDNHLGRLLMEIRNDLAAE